MQHWFFSRLSPSVASSAWFGAVIGAVFAFVVVLLLSIAFSLTLGSLLDRSSLSILSTGNVVAVSGPSSNSASFYSNPLLLLAYAHRSTLDVNYAYNNGSPDIPTISNAISESDTPPLTLLLIIPAIGLIFGGYLAASTNYGGRRLFSITRGASIGVMYALLILMLSLAASSTIPLGNTITTDVSQSLVITPDAISALLNALLWGVLFGALGGYLHSRSIPNAAPAGPGSRAGARIRGAFAGSALTLAVHFALCLLLVIGLYILAQIGGPSLQTEGSPGASGTGNCSIFLQQPGSSASSFPPNDLATHISYALISPALALYVMPVSMGAQFAIISGGRSITIGLFNSSCGPGTKGALFYLFLLLPAIAVFLGGRLAARSARPRTAREAAGVGLLFAAALTLLLLLLCAYIPIIVTLSERTSNTTGSLGPSLSTVLLAGPVFGAVFGVLGSVAGRQRNLPSAQTSTPSAWPAQPAGWPPTPQEPVQPVVSSALASFSPASAAPGPAAPQNQPATMNPAAPDDTLPPHTAGAAGSADPTPPTT